MTTQQNLIVDKSRRPTLSCDGRTISVHIPITLRHQGGRKQVVTPADAAPWIPRAVQKRRCNKAIECQTADKVTVFQ